MLSSKTGSATTYYWVSFYPVVVVGVEVRGRQTDTHLCYRGHSLVGLEDGTLLGGISR